MALAIQPAAVTRPSPNLGASGHSPHHPSPSRPGAQLLRHPSGGHAKSDVVVVDPYKTLHATTSNAVAGGSSSPANRRPRRDRPCDACRRRKSKCVVNPRAILCVLCDFYKQQCTFVQDPQPRKRKGPTSPSNLKEAKKRYVSAIMSYCICLSACFLSSPRFILSMVFPCQPSGSPFKNIKKENNTTCGHLYLCFSDYNPVSLSSLCCVHNVTTTYYLRAYIPFSNYYLDNMTLTNNDFAEVSNPPQRIRLTHRLGITYPTTHLIGR